ncbi:hypothetical protein Hanom_Chr15g01385351 [Helianthus anomalus]
MFSKRSVSLRSSSSSISETAGASKSISIVLFFELLTDSVTNKSSSSVTQEFKSKWFLKLLISASSVLASICFSVSPSHVTLMSIPLCSIDGEVETADVSSVFTTQKFPKIGNPNNFLLVPEESSFFFSKSPERSPFVQIPGLALSHGKAVWSRFIELSSSLDIF